MFATHNKLSNAESERLMVKHISREGEGERREWSGRKEKQLHAETVSPQTDRQIPRQLSRVIECSSWSWRWLTVEQASGTVGQAGRDSGTNRQTDRQLKIILNVLANTSLLRPPPLPNTTLSLSLYVFLALSLFWSLHSLPHTAPLCCRLLTHQTRFGLRHAANCLSTPTIACCFSVASLDNIRGVRNGFCFWRKTALCAENYVSGPQTTTSSCFPLERERGRKMEREGG